MLSSTFSLKVEKGMKRREKEKWSVVWVECEGEEFSFPHFLKGRYFIKSKKFSLKEEFHKYQRKLHKTPVSLSP